MEQNFITLHCNFVSCCHFSADGAWLSSSHYFESLLLLQLYSQTEESIYMKNASGLFDNLIIVIFYASMSWVVSPTLSFTISENSLLENVLS